MKKNLFIGIDISKKTLDVVVYSGEKKNKDEVNYLKVTNNSEGFKEVFKWLRAQKIKPADCVFGMENTGLYGFDLRLFLETKKIRYSVFSPLDLKMSMGLVRGKNDKVDASRIAYHTWLHRDELAYSKLAGSNILRLRDLLSERKRFVKQLAEYKALLTDNKGREITTTLIRYEKMKEILEEELKEVEKEMEHLIAEDEELLKNYQLLMSIKGIGCVNAISTLVHTNNFKAFENARQYACYVGVAPFDYQSGTSIKGRKQVSRLGAKGLKADLSQAAASAVTWDKEMKSYFERKSSEGKPYGVILNAVKFKIICRMFAVIKRGTPFVELQNYRN